MSVSWNHSGIGFGWGASCTSHLLQALCIKDFFLNHEFKIILVLNSWRTDANTVVSHWSTCKFCWQKWRELCSAWECRLVWSVQGWVPIEQAFKCGRVMGEPEIAKAGLSGGLHGHLLSNCTSVFYLLLAVGNIEMWFLLNLWLHWGAPAFIVVFFFYYYFFLFWFWWVKLDFITIYFIILVVCVPKVKPSCKLTQFQQMCFVLFFNQLHCIP